MTPAVAASEKLLTAEEYLRLEDPGYPTELVRGRIVRLNMPYSRHGYYCVNIAATLSQFVRQKQLGRVLSNDSGVVTEHDPDTVRGADMAFYSYNRVPAGDLPDGYWPAPELVFEVLSPTDRRGQVLQKVGEYLTAGVTYVCVVNPQTQSATIYSQSPPDREFLHDQTIEFPDILPGFQLPVRDIFA